MPAGASLMNGTDDRPVAGMFHGQIHVHYVEPMMLTLLEAIHAFVFNR